MKLLRNRYLYLVVIWTLALCACVSAQGDEMQECTRLDCAVLQKKLRLCDDAIETCKQLSDAQQQDISLYHKQLDNLQEEIDHQKDSDHFWQATTIIATILAVGATGFALGRH